MNAYRQSPAISYLVVCSIFFIRLLSTDALNQLPSRQGLVVKVAQESWKATYKRLVSELAPQSRTGAYDRPAAQFIGSQSQTLIQEPGRYHLYLGNPCPWCHRVALTYAILGLSSNCDIVMNGVLVVLLVLVLVLVLVVSEEEEEEEEDNPKIAYVSATR